MKVEELVERINPILEKLYWQGRENANIPVTSISVYPEIKLLLPIISEFIESYNERYDNYLYREVIGYIKEELDRVK